MPGEDWLACNPTFACDPDVGVDNPRPSLCTFQPSMGQPITASGLSEIFSAHEHFVLLSHTRPDGDAIGSEVALKSVLEEMGKSARALNEDPVPDNLLFLNGTEGVERPSGTVETEVVIALDTANRERLGEAARLLLAAHAALAESRLRQAAGGQVPSRRTYMP